MPHYKCVACRTRLYHAGAPLPDLVCDVCDGCGSALEPVGRLDEVVGFRFAGSPTTRLEDDHWTRGGGGLEAASLALAPPNRLETLT